MFHSARPLTHKMSLAALSLAAGLVFSGCAATAGDDDEGQNETIADEVAPLAADARAYAQEGAELAHPTQGGRRKRALFVGDPSRPRVVEYVETGDDLVFQGDIVLSPEHLRPIDEDDSSPVESEAEVGSAQQGLHAVNDGFLWPQGIVYFAIDPQLPDKTRVTKAIDHWRNKTSLRFVKRTNQKDYVYFTKGDGCAAMIGHVGGRQKVWLASNCSTGTVIHEIGHAIGLWHEHERADRGDHVRVRWENVVKGYESNFDKVDKGSAQTPTKYDRSSIMHYGSFYFSKNGKPTLVTKGGNTFEPNRSALSKLDVVGVERLYDGI